MKISKVTDYAALSSLYQYCCNVHVRRETIINGAMFVYTCPKKAFNTSNKAGIKKKQQQQTSKIF